MGQIKSLSTPNPSTQGPGLCEESPQAALLERRPDHRPEARGDDNDPPLRVRQAPGYALGRKMSPRLERSPFGPRATPTPNTGLPPILRTSPKKGQGRRRASAPNGTLNGAAPVPHTNRTWLVGTLVPVAPGFAEALKEVGEVLQPRRSAVDPRDKAGLLSHGVSRGPQNERVAKQQANVGSTN